MAMGRSNVFQTSNEEYTEGQVRAVLASCGIQITSETDVNFIGYCPFHGNRDTAAFTVSKEEGLFFCFNPVCGMAGNLEQLVTYIKKTNPFQTKRLILKAATDDAPAFDEQINSLLEQKPEWDLFPQEVLDELKIRFWETEPAIEYMRSRSFEDQTLWHFDVGYSELQDMVTVPMHEPNGQPIGLIGRRPSNEDKTFKNSPGLQKSKTLWNLNLAKRHGESVVVVEASFDAMRVHQAGYPNVVAVLGGYLSREQASLLNRYFSTIIIATDNDPYKKIANCRKCRKNGSFNCVGHSAGRELGKQISDQLPFKRIMWAMSGVAVYPDGAKDVGELDDDEIRHCIKNAISDFDYVTEVDPSL